ncbi:hypothetical protein [Paracoccus sp. (in: a-proteobacteria)]|uniref:hypothetical protein n=1 Tax=Paracoccus sp. TaxID=267 RepID=UPI0032203510
MLLDRSSEAIAHFIGLFHLDAEAARLRESYDAFRALTEAPPDQADLPHVTVSIRAPYDVPPFEPGLRHVILEPPPQPLAPGLSTFAAAVDPAPMRFPLPHPHLPGPEPLDLPPPQTVMPHWQVPLPNSMVTVTVQRLELSDNDFLDFGHGTEFVAPAELTAQLLELVDAAQGLTLGLSALMQPGELPATAALLELLAKADGLEADASDGVSVSVLHGAEAMGVVLIDGVAADAMPDIRASLPLALRREEDEDDSEDGDNPFAVAPGHHVNTGANLVANEAHVGSDWVDAPVIAVMGDVVRLQVISQVNVLLDRDSPALTGPDSLPSRAVNAARIELASSAAPGAEAAAVDPVFPRAWQVVRVEGDVISLNWTQSHNFVTDHDRAEIEFSGSNTFIEMGGNTLGNFASLVGLGFHYDLIIIGGSMITMNLIEQVNVLLDSDSIGGTLGPVTGISGGDNYLLNYASIASIGVDTVLALPDNFRAAGESLAGGAGTIPASLAQDPLFAGKTSLSVLYISGDLIEVNAIEQHNYVGDADQVYLALQEFVANAGDEITVTTGSNALVNDARITDAGIDSTVLAGGQIYTDALIHQAGLIDSGAAPSGVALPPLTGEAVAAFLASDMIDPPAGDDLSALPHVTGDGGSLDVMHSVLA